MRLINSNFDELRKFSAQGMRLIREIQLGRQMMSDVASMHSNKPCIGHDDGTFVIYYWGFARHECTQVRNIRNVADHLAQRIDYVAAKGSPVMGLLTWITFPQNTNAECYSCALAAGTIKKTNWQLVNPAGLTIELGPSQRTGEIHLAAGEHRAGLSHLIPEMQLRIRQLEKGVEMAVQEHGLVGKHGGADYFIAMKGTFGKSLDGAANWTSLPSDAPNVAIGSVRFALLADRRFYKAAYGGSGSMAASRIRSESDAAAQPGVRTVAMAGTPTIHVPRRRGSGLSPCRVFFFFACDRRSQTTSRVRCAATPATTSAIPAASNCVGH